MKINVVLKGDKREFYRFVINIFKGFSKIFFKYEVIGAENIPDRGNIVIASNHKSNLDPIFLVTP